MAAGRSEARSEARPTQKAVAKSGDVSEVQISDEVYQVCIAHALMTEHEEVMGLLLGDATGKSIRIWASLTLRRSDKRKDRVEISPEQLVEAAEMAEKITTEVGCQTRVVGWYHSHPHITCLPSHVDLQTQLQYQGMDGLFIGLIFAVFNADPRAGRMRHELMAFRAAGGGTPRRLELQPRVVPLSALLTEEQETLATSAAATSLSRCWGHNAMSAAAQQSFAEIQDRHREELLQSDGDGDALAWVDFCARHLQQLNALLASEVVPLRQHFDDAVHNAEVLAGVHRGHSEWVRRQPPGLLALPEASPSAPPSAAAAAPPLPPPAARDSASGQVAVVRDATPGERRSGSLSGFRGLACNCCPQAVGSGSNAQQPCRRSLPLGTAAGPAEPRPPAEGNSPLAVPEEDDMTQEEEEEEEEEEVRPSPDSPVVQEEGGGQEAQLRSPFEQAPARSAEVDLSLEQTSSRAHPSSSSGGAAARSPAAPPPQQLQLQQQQQQRKKKSKICGAMTTQGTSCKMACGDNTFCSKHRQKRKGSQGADDAAARSEGKRLRPMEEFEGSGNIEIDDVRSVYIATPCADSKRITGPHPDSVDGQAAAREFSVKDFGDLADSKAQQYLMGVTYADLARK